MVNDLMHMRYRLAKWKRRLEDVLLFPFILYGRLTAHRVPWNDDYETVFLFPYYHIGGAERVHYQIVQSVSAQKALMIFTKKSKDSSFLEYFQASGFDLLDVSEHTDNKLLYWKNIVYRGAIAERINRQKLGPVVFNGQCNFAYKLSRWVNPEVSQVELLHTFCGFSYIRVPFLPYYRKTIMISKRRIEDHLKMYRAWGVPEEYDARIHYLPNGIELEAVPPNPRKLGTAINLLFVGRGSAEKRPELAIQIAQELRSQGISLRFRCVGSVDPGEEAEGDFEFLGEITDVNRLQEVYRNQCDVLLVPSREEGFPLVVMEAMAFGAVILGTPVGDIPLHIENGVNGWVVNSVDDVDLIKSEAVAFVRRLLEQDGLFDQISQNNILYSQQHFDINIFRAAYRNLFESLRVRACSA